MEPKDEAWKNGKTMEVKVLPFEMTGLDATGRTVEGYGAAFGNIDQQGDVIKAGAFKNSITQRGGKVKFLWQHDVNEPIGKIQELREDEKGLYFKAVISDTQRGRDCIALLRDKAIDSLSIGYDALPGGTDYIKGADGQSIRALSDIRLWEISMVTFPANEEAVVTGLKQAGPSEVKPWDVFKRGDRWAVYKVDADGKPTGDALGTHDSEEEARAQVRALYASERSREKPDVGGASGGGQPVGGESGIVTLNAAPPPQEEKEETTEPTVLTAAIKAGRRVNADYLTRLKEARNAIDAWIKWASYEDEDEEETQDEPQAPPTPGAAEDNQQKQAGPVIPPTVAELERQTMELEVSLLEV